LSELASLFAQNVPDASRAASMEELGLETPARGHGAGRFARPSASEEEDDVLLEGRQRAFRYRGHPPKPTGRSRRGRGRRAKTATKKKK